MVLVLALKFFEKSAAIPSVSKFPRLLTPKVT